MALNLPENATEVVQRAKTDVQRAAPTSNPFLKNSWLGALVTGYANRVYDFYLQLKEALKQSLPDTSTGDYLARWAAIWGINRLPASFATGQVVFTGTATTSIPIATIVADSAGVEYATDAAVVISDQTISVTSITRSGTTATVTTTSEHNLASEVPVTIAGAVETEYNGVQTITVTGTTTFTFVVAGSPATPATGTITAAFTTALADVTASVAGVTGNQSADTELTLQSPISGVDNNAYVTYAALGGGVAVEDDEALRDRFLDRLQNPVALFNVSAITTQAKTIAGVTRVFVQPITPAVGQVTVYFMRDNETPSIPSATEVATVETALLEILPANTDPSDLIVAAPTAVPVAFTFTALSPNTATMKTAIEDNLGQFFDEKATVGANITEDAFRSVIYNTVDTVTGDALISFTLSAPVADVTIATGEIGTLGAVTFP